MAFWGCSSFIPCILALFAHFIPCILPLFVRFIPCILSLFVINSVKSRHLEDTMKRDLLDKLSVWKTHPLRMPLILRGARQVGKSWLVQEFGKQFQTFISINFDKEEAAKTLFSPNINIPKLLEKIAIYAGKKITAGETLLFLDEIQECEIALKALRYFKEEYPQLHVIATGSLIDFALEKIDMPVGRIEYLYLKALSFGEFLTVNGEDYLRNALMEEKVDVSIHGKLNELLKNYFWLGGMPAVVDTWLQYKDPAYCQAMQDRILISYIQDFEKYARKNQIANVEKVFNTIPEQLGQKFKSSRIDSEIKSLQKAIEAERSVVSNVRQAYRGILTQISQVIALQQSVISNKSALDATQAAFEVGTRTIVDVLNAQSDLLRARSDLSKAKYDYIIESFKLKRYVGLLTVEDVNIVNSWLQTPPKNTYEVPNIGS